MNLIKPKFLASPIWKSIDIRELKIKYEYNNKKYFIELSLIKENSFLKIIKIIKEIFIKIILINEIEEPIKIVIGISESKIKK